VTLDPFSLVAQLVNFVILLALLRFVLYGPILRTMRQREERIQATQAEAEAWRDEARADAEALRREREDADRTRRERLAELEREVDARRAARQGEIEREAEAKRAALAEALERDREGVVELLRRRTGDLLLAELRGALTHLADASLERQAVAAFRRRLERLDARTRDALRAAADSAPVVIATAFVPQGEARADLAAAVDDLLGGGREPIFARDDRLLLGVTLTVGGMRVDGSAEGRLAALEGAFDDALRELRGAARVRTAAPEAEAPT
jgi:F-type H+-transporting ATPase subunit b